jgi:hypothetical protein
MLKIGDLVMWTGKDEFHGMIGMITKAYMRTHYGDWYDVMWSDSTFGRELHGEEIMAVEDEERQQSET